MNTYVFQIGSRYGFNFTFQVMAENRKDAVRLAREQLFEQMVTEGDDSYLNIDLDFGLSQGRLTIYMSHVTEDQIISEIAGVPPTPFAATNLALT